MQVRDVINSLTQEWAEVKKAKISFFVMGITCLVVGGSAVRMWDQRQIDILEARLGGQEDVPKPEQIGGGLSGPRPGNAKALFMSGWGGSGSCHATLEGKAVVEFAADYVVALICGVKDGSVDKYQDENIIVTSAFNITSEVIEITVPYTASFNARLNSVAERTAKNLPIGGTFSIPVWHQPVLLKKGVDPNVINRLGDVATYGGIIHAQYGEFPLLLTKQAKPK